MWGFLGEGARWPSGVCRTRERAEPWIKAGKLAGMLTESPDTGVCDWAIEHGHFQPRAAHQQTPRSSTASRPRGRRTSTARWEPGLRRLYQMYQRSCGKIAKCCDSPISSSTARTR
ncbi:DUF7710 domain-containing protein [Planobispora rosea]|uniref:DUF7710 domain-containing protein n=1 Tax=Planobispora rosea TaxID=35762 RepID=UPI00403AEF5A